MAGGPKLTCRLLLNPTLVFMRNVIATLLFVATSLVVACNVDNEIVATPGPEILFGEDERIYSVKTGREVRIAPTYRNVEDATYRWTIENREVGNEPTYIYTAAQAPATVYIGIEVTTPSGRASDEVRIDVVERLLPKIVLVGAEAGFSLVEGETMTFAPQVVDDLPVTYLWSVEGEEVADTPTYTFVAEKEGEYRLTLETSNEDGNDRIDFLVTVYTSPEVLPIGWTFDQMEYNMTLGHTLHLAPATLSNGEEAVYTWTMDGTELQKSAEPAFDFTPTAKGDYTLVGTMSKGEQSLSHTFTIHVFDPNQYYRPATPSSKATADRVLDFTPAPGQFINEYADRTITTAQEACAYALEMFDKQSYVSLGAFGGYVVVGFDHSIDAVEEGYDLAVRGNSFDGASEPGIVWVMQDENGDGLANDTWYELRGSEYDKEGTIHDYAVTYTRSTQDIPWQDNQGSQGTVERNPFHTQESYYPAWVAEESYTLRGTRLAPNNSYEYSDQYGVNIWIMKALEWGYADNYGNDKENVWNRFRIANAVDNTGNPVNLKYVDFVKVQSAVLSNCSMMEGNMSSAIGEVSTEVCGVADYQLMK